MTLSLRTERLCLVILLIVFTCFTAHGLRMFFSGDDMMNMYGAWKLNAWALAKSLVLIWMPIYRPLGAAVYRIFYAIFGFHNLPLYVFCWLMLACNVLLSYKFFRTMGATIFAALIALCLTLVHGNFQDLYLSAGTIYDRLWFLFTMVGLIFYARNRTTPRAWWTVGLLCVLSMDSKESGVALPVLLVCYELVFILPGVWSEGRVKAWLTRFAPLYGVLGAMCIVFILRVGRTPELGGQSAYQPHASAGLWLSHMGEYFTALAYGHVTFGAASVGILLAAMAVGAALTRNRLMIFGWLFFVITITPVALITTRPGYVLYVPDVGLGLYAAGVIGLLPAMSARLQLAMFILILSAVTWFHARNWPGPFPPEESPEKRYSEQFEREYPKLPAHSKLLFVSDDFPPPSWDLQFNTWLLYHDRSILIDRVMGPPEQRPKKGAAVHYDHVFAQQDGHYLELDNRDVANSIRLHILRNYSVGREMDFGRRDFAAYVVSGVLDGDSAEPSRWIGPKAQLKFDVYPAPAIFSAYFYVPDVVAKPPLRTLSILVGGRPVGTFPMAHDGLMEVHFPVASDQITLNGFTIVEMDVDHPYKDANGQEFGVVLMRAGFAYQDAPIPRMK